MEKKERPIDRIREFIDWLIAKKIVRSIAQFEVLCGMSKRYIQNMEATDKGNVGVDTVATIYDAFPQVSLKWLVTGNGAMFSSKNEEEIAEKIRLDIIAREVISATNEKKDIKEALRLTLQQYKDELTPEEKIALLEKLI